MRCYLSQGDIFIIIQIFYFRRELWDGPRRKIYGILSKKQEIYKTFLKYRAYTKAGPFVTKFTECTS